MGVIGAFIIQIWERVGTIMPNYGFDNYFNCVWFVFGTIVSLGYGDYLVTSLPARFTCVILVLFGALTIGVLIVYFKNYIKFTDGDLKAYINLNQILNLVSRKENNKK